MPYLGKKGGETEMKSYVVSYDLCKPEQNYEALIRYIRDYGFYAKINKSTWIVKTDTKASDIRTKLKSAIDENDKLFVAQLTGAAAWTICDCSDEWLKQNL